MKVIAKAVAIMVCSTFATAAWADSAHFVKGPTASLDNEGAYVVSFKEAGLGNTPITYVLTADANFTFQCYTKSNNAPQGDPNHISISNLSTFETLTPRNGQITGSIQLSPEQDGAHCQGKGLKLCLNAVSYTDVFFQDSTNNVPPAVGNPPAANMPSLSATFSEPICDF